MKLLERLRELVGGGGRTGDPNGIYLYVRCGRCGETLEVRADKRFDLVRDYDKGGYVLHKEMLGSQCFSLMHATVRLDDNKRILSREIQGGEFITEEEFRGAAEESRG